jgi:hypothetical protein
LCKAVVDRFTGLLFGESRKPKVIVENDHDTQDALHAAMEQCLFWAKWRQARTMGGACGSVLVTVHVRNGEFSLEIHNPKHLQVLWKDRRSLIPEGVLKMYKYPVEEEVVDERTREVKGTQTVWYLYRRIITSYEDVVYKPARLEPALGGLDWVPEDGGIAQHNLGFFPGAWIQNRARLDDVEGDPDCYGGYQMIDTMDRIVSQINKGVLLNLDPTLVLNYDHREVEAAGGIRKGSDHALVLGTSGNARYLEIGGSGTDAGMKTYQSLLDNFLRLVRCVFVDPQTISGAAQSAKAIEYIYQPMLEAADDLRAQYGELGVVRILGIMEKILRKNMGDGTEVDEQGRQVKRVFKLPKKAVKEGGQSKFVEQSLGPGGRIRLIWPAYFAPTETDKQSRIANAVAAKTGGLVDQVRAVGYTSDIFAIDDVDEAVATIKSEQEHEMEQALGAPMDGSVPPPATPAE